MIKKIKTILLICILSCLVGTLPVFGQKKETSIKDKKITIKMEKQPLGLVFRYLMENYDIPIGFEESILDRGHSEYEFLTNLPAVTKHKGQNSNGSIKFTTTVERAFKAKLHPITVNFENGSLEDVFNQIIEQMKNYAWEINDGVVNIYPIKGRDSRFEQLLGLQIKSFTLKKGSTVNDITTEIQTLRVFLRFMHKNQLYFYGERTGSSSEIKAQYGRTIDTEMNFSNVTFKELLNKITKEKKGGWRLKWMWISEKTKEENIDIDI